MRGVVSLSCKMHAFPHKAFYADGNFKSRSSNHPSANKAIISKQHAINLVMALLCRARCLDKETVAELLVMLG